MLESVFSVTMDKFDFDLSSRSVKGVVIVGFLCLVILAGWVGVGFMIQDAEEVNVEKNPFYGDSEGKIFPNTSQDFVVEASFVSDELVYRSDMRYDADEGDGILRLLNGHKRVVWYLERNSTSGNFTTYSRYDIYEENDSASYSMGELNEQALQPNTFSESDETCLRNDRATQFTSGETDSTVGEFIAPIVIPYAISGSPLVEMSERTYEIDDGFIVQRSLIFGQVIYVSSDGQLQFDKDSELTNTTLSYSSRTVDGKQVGPLTLITDVDGPQESIFEYTRSVKDVDVDNPVWINESDCFSEG